jgi:hypothetical protein
VLNTSTSGDSKSSLVFPVKKNVRKLQTRPAFPMETGPGLLCLTADFAQAPVVADPAPAPPPAVADPGLERLQVRCSRLAALRWEQVRRVLPEEHQPAGRCQEWWPADRR